MSMRSRREEVLQLLVTEGLSDKEIADRLVLSAWTVRNYITALLAEFRVDSRVKIVARWHAAQQHEKVFRAHDHN